MTVDGPLGGHFHLIIQTAPSPQVALQNLRQHRLASVFRVQVENGPSHLRPPERERRHLRARGENGEIESGAFRARLRSGIARWRTTPHPGKGRLFVFENARPVRRPCGHAKRPALQVEHLQLHRMRVNSAMAMLRAGTSAHGAHSSSIPDTAPPSGVAAPPRHRWIAAEGRIARMQGRPAPKLKSWLVRIRLARSVPRKRSRAATVTSPIQWYCRAPKNPHSASRAPTNSHESLFFAIPTVLTVRPFVLNAPCIARKRWVMKVEAFAGFGKHMRHSWRYFDFRTSCLKSANSSISLVLMAVTEAMVVRISRFRQGWRPAGSEPSSRQHKETGK